MRPRPRFQPAEYKEVGAACHAQNWQLKAVQALDDRRCRFFHTNPRHSLSPIISPHLFRLASAAGGKNLPTAISEPDPAETFALAEAAQNDFVAVFKELALFAAWKRQGFSSVSGQLQQAS